MTFGIIRLICVALFSVSIPMLALARFRRPRFPAWRLIALATVLGWLLPFAYKSLREPMIEQFDRERMENAAEYMRNPPPPIQHADGSIEVDNPLALVDYLPEEYHPVESLIYGPAYLMCCWGAAWLLFRRSAASHRLRIVLVSVGVLLAGCLAIWGEFIRLRPPTIFSDGVLIYGWNPFFGLQLFFPLSVIAAWVLAAWLPSVLVAAIRRHVP